MGPLDGVANFFMGLMIAVVVLAVLLVISLVFNPFASRKIKSNTIIQPDVELKIRNDTIIDTVYIYKNPKE
jgi:hypothetical protein